MRILVIPQCDYLDEVIGGLEDKRYELLILSSKAVAVKSPATTALLQSSNPKICKAAIGAFQPDAAVILPYASDANQWDISVPTYTVNFGVAGHEDFHVPEFVPIWDGAETSTVTVRCDGAELASETVPVHVLDTAITLRVKHLPVATKLLVAHLPKAISTQEFNAETRPAPFGGKVQADWTNDKVERFIRAMTFPSREPAIWQENGEDFFIDTFAQYKTHVAGQATREEPNGRGPYAADTHWYSNMGGAIIKAKHPGALSLRKRSSRHTIPGQALKKGAKSKLRMNEPLIGLSAETYCKKVLGSGWLGVEGPMVKQFEAMMARICGCNAAVAVQSGTAALYGAMKALGVSDAAHHVICPAFTCAACADAVVHAGGTPVIADCELDSFGLSYESVKSALSPAVVGVVVAPCYGVPSRDHLKILELCQSKGIWLCEDNCESYGALMETADGETAPVGSMSTMSVISVRSEKMVGVGEGGLILSCDAGLVEQARWWCSRAPCRGVGLWRVYDHEAVGQNFRLPEMLAAIGIAGGENLPLMMQKKRQIHKWYRQYIDLPVVFQKPAAKDQPVWWITSIILPESLSAEEMGMKLMELFPHIETRPAFFPLSQMSPFQPTGKCPNADYLHRRLLCLPSSANLRECDVKEIAEALRDTAKAIRAAKRDDSSSFVGG